MLLWVTVDGHLMVSGFLPQTLRVLSFILDLGTELNMKRYLTNYCRFIFIYLYFLLHC